ncbi:hypothetical protein COCOBI_06-6280 [Coccomyxa sp. Obi]|nr:hypothetical protein COCOBI_06-6280 [Coccomyxa sp. Obi]
MCIDAMSGLILTTSANTCTNTTGYCVLTGLNSVYTSQFGGSCVPINTSNGLCGPNAPANGKCIDATSGLSLTTSTSTCTNATGYCAPTSVNSICTSQFGGICVPTNTSNGLCGLAKPTTPIPTGTTSLPPSTLSQPPRTTALPASTPRTQNTSTAMIASASPGPYAPTNGTCIDTTSGLNLTTAADRCTNATGYCAPTGVYSVCTAQRGGSCVPTNTSYALCGEFSSCIAAPESLGFDDLPLGMQTNPLPYFGLNFSVTGPQPVLVVANTGAPSKLLQGASQMDNFDDTSVNIKDLGATADGAFTAISMILRAYYINPAITGVNVDVTGSRNGTVNPFCQQTILEPTVARKVDLGANNGACTVDELSFGVPVQSPGTQNTFIARAIIDLDDFVVCKANMLSSLLPVS